MKKVLLSALLAAFAFAGCSATRSLQYYPTPQGNAWNIQVHGPYGGVSVAINGKKIITGLSTTSFQSATSFGYYDHHKIKATMFYSSGLLGIGSYSEVLVFVDGKLAADVRL